MTLSKAKTLTTILIAAVVLVICTVAVIIFAKPTPMGGTETPTTQTEPMPILSSAVIEAGSQAISADLYRIDADSDVHILTDPAYIDTSTPGCHTITLSCNGQTYTCILQVTDTTAPTAIPVDQDGFVGDAVNAADFVTEIVDCSDVTVAFATEPDVTFAGTQNVSIILTDAFGNASILTAKLTLSHDTTPPAFGQLRSITIEVGESVSYKSGVTVTDNRDGTITNFTVDKTGIDLMEPGTYTITYTATDRCGNTATATRTLIVEPKPVITREMVDTMAQEILDDIIDDDMTQYEALKAIFNYVRNKITYKNIVEEDLCTAAYYAVKKGRGDCYNYYALSTILLDNYGVDNMMITRIATSDTRHYWLLVNPGTGWYHFDACPTVAEYQKRCFMWTDKQVADYSASRTDGRTDYYAFDPTLYPERATEKYTG